LFFHLPDFEHSFRVLCLDIRPLIGVMPNTYWHLKNSTSLKSLPDFLEYEDEAGLEPLNVFGEKFYLSQMRHNEDVPRSLFKFNLRLLDPLQDFQNISCQIRSSRYHHFNQSAARSEEHFLLGNFRL